MTLVLEDFERGLGALAALSGDLQRREATLDAPTALLGRALMLPGVRGSALYHRGTGQFYRGVGVCQGWPDRPPRPRWLH